MKTLHRRCAGLDVHSDTVVACVRLTGRSKPRHEVRRFSTATHDLPELADWLAAQGVTHIAMEATGIYWKPVWHMLEGRFQLILANAAHIRNVPGRKSDVNDAVWISDLLAHGLIRASFVPPAPIQELRDLTRTRTQLSREVAQHVQRIQKTLEDANIKLVSVLSDIVGMSGRRILNAMISGETPCSAYRGAPEISARSVVGPRRDGRWITDQNMGDRHEMSTLRTAAVCLFRVKRIGAKCFCRRLQHGYAVRRRGADPR